MGPGRRLRRAALSRRRAARARPLARPPLPPQLCLGAAGLAALLGRPARPLLLGGRAVPLADLGVLAAGQRVLRVGLDRVLPGAAVDRVGLVIAGVDVVVAVAAVDLVLALATEDAVVVGAAVERVVAEAAGDAVVPLVAADGVVPLVPEQLVVRGGAVDRVVAAAALVLVGLRRAGERIGAAGAVGGERDGRHGQGGQRRDDRDES